LRSRGLRGPAFRRHRDRDPAGPADGRAPLRPGSRETAGFVGTVAFFFIAGPGRRAGPGAAHPGARAVAHAGPDVGTRANWQPDGWDSVIMTPVPGDQVIGPGTSVSVNFFAQGDPGGPANCTFNGFPCD